MTLNLFLLSVFFSTVTSALDDPQVLQEIQNQRDLRPAFSHLLSIRFHLSFFRKT